MTDNLYKELNVWHVSVQLIKDVYNTAESLPRSEEINLKQQLKRAVVSVALNIAEGKDRRTAKDFTGFLTSSVSSLAEVEAILVISEELGFIQRDNDIHEKIQRLGEMLNLLRSKLLARKSG